MEPVKKTEAAAAGMVKESRKTRYTRKALQDSLIELMKSKSIVRIAVKEICDLADISRSTFYTHYNNQYDLLKQIEEGTIAYFEAILKKFDKRRNAREITQMVEEIVRNIADNSSSIQVLLSENGDTSFQERFFRRFTRQSQLVNYFVEPALDIPELGEYYLVYSVNGSIALVRHWLKNNMDIPVTTLAKMLVQLFPVTNNFYLASGGVPPPGGRK
ncbi:MAG: TetR/AcrR family transcriptional regulator [Treponema sp.]|jgi:AcrR family transcriptional regulator|nr:TetR/AcrR family transcriptional regulator [Treponema sp.]